MDFIRVAYKECKCEVGDAIGRVIAGGEELKARMCAFASAFLYDTSTQLIDRLKGAGWR